MTLLELARRLDTSMVLEAEIIVLGPGREELVVTDAYTGLAGRVVLRAQKRNVAAGLAEERKTSNEE